MHNILYYLSEPYTYYTIWAPWMFIVYWYFAEGRRNPPHVKVVLHWMLVIIASYSTAKWRFNDDTLSLFIIDCFFIYLAFFLWSGFKMTAGTAFVFSYLGLFSVDLTKALELVEFKMASMNTFYFGVGGAGLGDGLCIFPLCSAALVHYVAWRRKISSHKQTYQPTNELKN